MSESIIVTWTMIRGRLEEHEENIKKNMGSWRKNAKRFKLKSMRYFAQALGGYSFHYGRVLVLEFETLNDWESFRTYIEENEKAYTLKEKWLDCIDVKTLRIIEWQERQREAWLT
jgi:hypothetical protein